MISILFFRHLIALSNYLSISLSDLTPTVTSSFDIHTDFAEHEVEHIVKSIFQSFCDVTNIQSIGFVDSAGKLILISDLNNRVTSITFFYVSFFRQCEGC